MQTHHVAQVLGKQYGRKTRAHWSTTPARHVVVFVHGFGGHPIKTWPNFPSLLPNASVPPFDFLFFGYDGLQQQTTNSAGELLRFLEVFLADPATLINATIPSLERRASFFYDRVVIVAHSLGAVVTRRALLDARAGEGSGKSYPWLARTRIVLFAPAHMGAYAAALASSALTGQPWFLGGLVGLYVRYRSPLLTDLQAGSTVLTALVNDSQVAGAVGPTPSFIKSHSVCLATKDRVVINAGFPLDPPPRWIDADHLAVCKPRRADHDALTAVWEAIR